MVKGRGTLFRRSLGYAVRGLVHSWKTQRHLRFHGAATGIAVTAAAWLELARWEWAVLVVVIGCVIAAEVMNTAVEITVDLVEPHYHPLAGLAKDVAAAAVLIAALQAVIVGVIIFAPHLLDKLG